MRLPGGHSLPPNTKAMASVIFMANFPMITKKGDSNARLSSGSLTSKEQRRIFCPNNLEELGSRENISYELGLNSNMRKGGTDFV